MMCSWPVLGAGGIRCGRPITSRPRSSSMSRAPCACVDHVVRGLRVEPGDGRGGHPGPSVTGIGPGRAARGGGAGGAVRAAGWVAGEGTCGLRSGARLGRGEHRCSRWQGPSSSWAAAASALPCRAWAYVRCVTRTRSSSTKTARGSRALNQVRPISLVGSVSIPAPVGAGPSIANASAPRPAAALSRISRGRGCGRSAGSRRRARARRGIRRGRASARRPFR